MIIPVQLYNWGPWMYVLLSVLKCVNCWGGTDIPARYSRWPACADLKNKLHWTQSILFHQMARLGDFIKGSADLKTLFVTLRRPCVYSNYVYDASNVYESFFFMVCMICYCVCLYVSVNSCCAYRCDFCFKSHFLYEIITQNSWLHLVLWKARYRNTSIKCLWTSIL